MLAELAELKWKSECKSCPYLVDQKDSIFDVVERFSGEKIYFKKLNYKNILILNSGKVRLDYMSQSTSFVMTSHDMTFLTETPDLVLTFIEDSTLLLMRFESYEVVCKRTKLDSYLSGSESVGFIKPTFLPMLTSFRRLSTVAERLFTNKLLCSYYQKITRDSFFFLLDLFYSENQLVSFLLLFLIKNLNLKTSY